MRFEVNEEEMLVLAATQDEIDADPADTQTPDRVLAGKTMALRELIEDELILTLPYAPRHEDCSVDAAAGNEEGLSAFAGLRGLLRGRP
jgi:uncharacterized protein